MLFSVVVIFEHKNRLHNVICVRMCLKMKALESKQVASKILNCDLQRQW